ncbi:MAG: hypothetical protein HY392_00770 [Candidatus Diapherotrites archaeon]|nr:hypothetical protein [Candidatus Diapherotrites archaeon]
MPGFLRENLVQIIAFGFLTVFLFVFFSFLGSPSGEESLLSPLLIFVRFLAWFSSFFVAGLFFFFNRNKSESFAQKTLVLGAAVFLAFLLVFTFQVISFATLSQDDWEQSYLDATFISPLEFSFEEFRSIALLEAFFESLEFFFQSLGSAFFGWLFLNIVFRWSEFL